MNSGCSEAVQAHPRGLVFKGGPKGKPHGLRDSHETQIKAAGRGAARRWVQALNILSVTRPFIQGLSGDLGYILRFTSDSKRSKQHKYTQYIYIYIGRPNSNHGAFSVDSGGKASADLPKLVRHMAPRHFFCCSLFSLFLLSLPPEPTVPYTTFTWKPRRGSISYQAFPLEKSSLAVFSFLPMRGGGKSRMPLWQTPWQKSPALKHGRRGRDPLRRAKFFVRQVAKGSLLRAMHFSAECTLLGGGGVCALAEFSGLIPHSLPRSLGGNKKKHPVVLICLVLFRVFWMLMS